MLHFMLPQLWSTRHEPLRRWRGLAVRVHAGECRCRDPSFGVQDPTHVCSSGFYIFCALSKPC